MTSVSIRRPGTTATRWLLAAALALVPVGTSAAAAAKAARPAASAPVDAAALTQRCEGCHNDPTIKSEAGKSVAVSSDAFDRSAHHRLDCSDCHEAGTSVKHPANPLGAVKPGVCQDCHADQFKAVAGGVHGRHAKGERAIQDCTGCHGSLHEVLKAGDVRSPMSPVNQIKACGECHDDIMANYDSSVHARALLRMGLTANAPSCSSCHGTHEIHEKTDLAATTNAANLPNTCGKCHSGILAEWQQSTHGTLWKKAVDTKAADKGPVCSTCHTPHAIKNPDSAAVRNQVSERCGTCHEKRFTSFRDSFHGQASSLSQTGAAVCADCHTPHHNLPASDPNSSINPAHLAQTCGACHKNVNASFLTFDPHADPKDPKRSIVLFATWAGMTALLLGVFGFFGLHDLLWLQRAIVGLIRGEFKNTHLANKKGAWVRRFSTPQIALHVTIVTSFLLLAATGLPLKFAEAPWAPGLIAVFGGRETAGVLHRFAAIVTFGYFAWHLGTLAYGWLVKKERGYFWGARSMVPQPADLLDLWAMVKYFFYAGPRPKFDRFTYWEKFDYMGVFWGVAVIGASGLILWFPTAATTLLPGFVLNVAYVVHSDEALLATGFIFLFHFFHTHLRPESFPMDTVVFTGRMPLETFEEERPLEYQKLVASGTLEQRLTPAPTSGEMKVAYIFGSIALGVGIVLAVFIFWALLGGFMH